MMACVEVGVEVVGGELCAQWFGLRKGVDRHAVQGATCVDVCESV
jgi:hypothetical protein